MIPTRTDIPRFEDELQGRVAALQESLAALCASIDADLAVPYPLSKRLGVDKNLTWKAARILQAQDPSTALKHLPGPSGLGLLLEGFRRQGAPEERVRAVDAAIRAIEGTVQRHTDDRATLELVLDGMEHAGGERLETSRKLAFRGNSGVWGVQARTRLTTSLIAPSAGDPDLLDLVLVAGFHRFRRLREGTTWPVLRLRTLGEGGASTPPRGAEPLDPAGAIEGGPSILTAFSSRPTPEVRPVRTPRFLSLELPPGPVGNPGALDLVFGERHRAFASPYRDRPTDMGEHHTDLELPVENLLFDLFVHRDLPLAESPHFQLLGRLGRELPTLEMLRAENALPLHEEIVLLSTRPADVATELMPGYGELLEWVAGRAGWDLGDFRLLRVTMRHPPVPTTAVLSYPLAARP